MTSISAPSYVTYDELPVYGVPPPDRTWLLEQTLQELERGVFVNAARLCDSMLRDDRIYGTLQTRTNGLLGMPIDLEPGKDTARGRSVVEDVEQDWSDMFPAHDLAEIKRWGLLLGVCVAEKAYDVGPGSWDFRIKKVWHPQALIWNWSERRYYLTTENKAQIALPHPWEDSSQWMIYTPYGYERAWLRGLVRPLSKPWMIRNWTDRDFARWCEVHGLAIKKAITPQTAKDSEKKDFFQQVTRLNSESTIRTPVDKDGNRFDVELLEAKSDGFMGFVKRIELCDKNIAVVTLGQNMSTDGSSGLGSDSNPGDSVRIDLKKFDNVALSQFIYKQGLRQWARFNYGSEDLAPKPPSNDKKSGFWTVEPPEDKSKAAEVLTKTAAAIVAFGTANAPVDVRLLLDQAGIPVLTLEAHAAQQQQKLEQAQQMMATQKPKDPEDDAADDDAAAVPQEKTP